MQEHCLMTTLAHAIKQCPPVLPLLSSRAGRPARGRALRSLFLHSLLDFYISFISKFLFFFSKGANNIIPFSLISWCFSFLPSSFFSFLPVFNPSVKHQYIFPIFSFPSSSCSPSEWQRPSRYRSFLYTILKST